MSDITRPETLRMRSPTPWAKCRSWRTLRFATRCPNSRVRYRADSQADLVIEAPLGRASRWTIDRQERQGPRPGLDIWRRDPGVSTISRRVNRAEPERCGGERRFARAASWLLGRRARCAGSAAVDRS